jgi:hypothetical protein
MAISSLASSSQASWDQFCLAPLPVAGSTYPFHHHSWGC